MSVEENNHGFSDYFALLNNIVMHVLFYERVFAMNVVVVCITFFVSKVVLNTNIF